MCLVNNNGKRQIWIEGKFVLVAFLGELTKLRKASISFVMSVRSRIHLCVRMKQLDSHWKDFDKTWCLGFFRNSVKKIQVSLKSKKNNVCFTLTLHIYDNIFLEYEMFLTNTVEKIKAHFTFSIFFSENCTIYEIMSEKLVQP